jgi:hypothetical protein
MFSGSLIRKITNIVLGFCLVAVIPSCGEKETQYDVNLLENPSFEDVKDGVPKHWDLVHFRGLENQQEVLYGIDKTSAADGENSWNFTADPGTRKWYALTQEVEVENATHVRLEGWMRTENAHRKKDQYAQCNYILTYFDGNHDRFQVLRFGDKRTKLRTGTQLWAKEDNVFRVPEGTRYIAVSCMMGMDGRVWFDNVSLTIPQPLEWQTARTENYVFHWMRENPFPAGSMQQQQWYFDHFSERLGIESDVVVKYYLYPDTASIREHLSLRGFQYASWDDKEFHSINPNDNHEVIHFITDPYGTPTRGIVEGTVFWLHDNWQGAAIHPTAALLLSQNRLPGPDVFTEYIRFAQVEPVLTIPAASSFVKFVAEGWGTERLMELYKTSSGANSYVGFAAAFKKVYGISCEDVEEQWRLALRRIKVGEAQEEASD